MRHLYFVRHGESEYNQKGLFAGQTDTPLTDHGREEAELAGNDALNYKIDLIVSSPLSRAKETAQIIARKIQYPETKIIFNDIFREHFIGQLAGKPWADYEEFDGRFDDIETWQALVDRAEKSLDFIKGLPADNILLVGHGAFVRALQTVIDDQKEYGEPANAKIIELI